VNGPEDDLFSALSQRLLEAHRRVARLDLPQEEKARATKRILAVSDAAKHDLGRASKRLDALLTDLDAGRVAAGGDDD
jgi:hypothetical protein